MSNFVVSNNSLTFGEKSPFNKVMTDSGVKESFFNTLVNYNSNIIRKRSFNTYVLANKIFPSSSIQISEYVKFSIGQMLSYFINGPSINYIVNNIDKIPKQRYYQGEVALTNELIKATGVKNLVVMMCDTENSRLVDSKGITSFITRSLKDSESNDLSVSWNNKFFSFNNPNDLSIIITIPKKYISNIILTTYSSCSQQGIGSSIDIIPFKENVAEIMTLDLIKSIFISLYSDGYRTRINKDIMTIGSIFEKEGKTITLSSGNSSNTDSLISSLAKYSSNLKTFKNKDNENLIYKMLSYNEYRSSTIINPIEFYKSFIDIPYNQINMVLKRIPSLKRLNTDYNIELFDYNQSNNLQDIDTFFSDNERDIALYCIKVIRFLPFLLFNTYVIGNGNNHTNLLQFISNLNKILPTLNSFRSSSPIFSNITEFINNELKYLTTDFLINISSPMSVNANSKKIILNAINRYSEFDDSVIDSEEERLIL